MNEIIQQLAKNNAIQQCKENKYDEDRYGSISNIENIGGSLLDLLHLSLFSLHLPQRYPH